MWKTNIVFLGWKYQCLLCKAFVSLKAIVNKYLFWFVGERVCKARSIGRLPDRLKLIVCLAGACLVLSVQYIFYCSVNAFCYICRWRLSHSIQLWWPILHAFLTKMKLSQTEASILIHKWFNPNMYESFVFELHGLKISKVLRRVESRISWERNGEYVDVLCYTKITLFPRTWCYLIWQCQWWKILKLNFNVNNYHVTK